MSKYTITARTDIGTLSVTTIAETIAHRPAPRYWTLVSDAAGVDVIVSPAGSQYVLDGDDNGAQFEQGTAVGNLVAWIMENVE